MKKLIQTIVVLFCMLIPLYSSPWSGGYRIEVGGFDDGIHTSKEHLGLSFVYTPHLSSQGAVELYGGISLSNPFYQSVSTFVNGGVSLSHLITQQTIFDTLLIRDSSWWVKADLCATVPISSVSKVLIQGKITPFSLFFGDKVISIASPVMNYDIGTRTFGWGLSLFELTHYLW